MRRIKKYAGWCRKNGTTQYGVTVLECSSKKEFRKYMKENNYEIEKDCVWLFN